MSDIYLSGASKKIILNGTTYFASGGGGGSAPTLITKSITENGTYSAEDDSADGYSEVVVNVQSKLVNPIYNWFTNDDETLVVREKISDGSYRWYFNGCYVPTNPFLAVPSNLTKFIKNQVIVGCKKHNLDSYKSDCMIGFYTNTIRAWTQGLGGNVSGKIWAIMESSDTGSNTYPDQCYHAWEEPSFDPING